MVFGYKRKSITVIVAAESLRCKDRTCGDKTECGLTYYIVVEAQDESDFNNLAWHRRGIIKYDRFRKLSIKSAFIF